VTDVGNRIAVRVEGLGIEYDLRLSPHRTLRQTLADTLRGRKTPAPRFWALDDVGFTVHTGDAFAIVGDNGSGKSTLLLALAGILRPDRGRIETYGTASALLTLGAGFEPLLTGRENIYLNAAFLGTPRKVIEERLDEIVEFAELGSFIDTAVAKYSTGMRARLGFAIAAHIEPDILLLDEVLSVGDIAFRAKSERRMAELAESAKAIVVVSHSMEFVLERCTRALWLQGGKVEAYGPSEEVVRAYTQARNVREIRQRVSF
jgi:ABC-type polysaccharide/polyol phosphate transport system ATPase subunit